MVLIQSDSSVGLLTTYWLNKDNLLCVSQVFQHINIVTSTEIVLSIKLQIKWKLQKGDGIMHTGKNFKKVDLNWPLYESDIIMRQMINKTSPKYLKYIFNNSIVALSPTITIKYNNNNCIISHILMVSHPTIHLWFHIGEKLERRHVHVCSPKPLWNELFYKKRCLFLAVQQMIKDKQCTYSQLPHPGYMGVSWW